MSFLSACGGSRAGTGTNRPEEPKTYLVVENRGPVDMTVYVLRGAQRYRLGICPGTSTRRFVIPGSLVFGATPLRFLADPIGSNRTPVSNEIPVRPGDEVQLLIPWSS
ncbi:MAG TPA: hypothetical protein VJ672_12125 [Gemmatimonadaceae bacterium]|nr:hypothetical protein [Gemmatimonadaceae bacterium]